jgi:hypothetical protein
MLACTAGATPACESVSSTNPIANSTRDRVVFQPEAQGEVEDHLGVGRALDLRERAGVEGEHQLTAHGREVVDQPVVDEQPAPVRERVAVALLDRRSGGSSHVRQEQRRLDVGRQVAQVGIAPRRGDAAVDARAFARPVPADPEAVAVGRLRPEAECTLVDQAVPGPEQEPSSSTGRPCHAIHLHMGGSSPSSLGPASLDTGERRAGPPVTMGLQMRRYTDAS